MICLQVVPRTIESSTSSTFLPLNSSSMALSFCRTDFLRSLCPGIINVRPIYLFLTNPSRYFRPRRLASSTADVRLVSGIGITTSMSLSGRSRFNLSASFSPMRRRALYTEIPSIKESGRAKYTCSKIQGVCSPCSVQTFVCRLPSTSMNTASPGATSLSIENP